MANAKDWVPLAMVGIISGTILALGLTEKFLRQPVQLVCNENCAVLADLAAQQSMAAAAWWMLIVGVLSLLATAGGILFVRATLLETRTATKLAAKQVELSRHALISTDRALVFFSHCSYLSYKRPDGTIYWGITVNWINSGSTPAIDVLVGAAHRVSSDPLPSDWAFDIPVRRTPITLGPGAGMASSPEFIAEPQQIVDAGRGKLNYHIWGTVTYRDVFEGTLMHQTTFCVAITRYSGDPTQYFDDENNPVRIYFTNENANHSFS